MLDLGTAIQDYLPEDQRTSPMSLIDFLEAWTGKKSYNEICMLRSDIRSYLRKHTQGITRLMNCSFTTISVS